MGWFRNRLVLVLVSLVAIQYSSALIYIHRDDAAQAVNYYRGARHKCYLGLQAARIAYYLGDRGKGNGCAPPTDGQPGNPDGGCGDQKEDNTDTDHAEGEKNQERHWQPPNQGKGRSRPGKSPRKPKARSIVICASLTDLLQIFPSPASRASKATADDPPYVRVSADDDTDVVTYTDGGATKPRHPQEELGDGTSRMFTPSPAHAREPPRSPAKDQHRTAEPIDISSDEEECPHWWVVVRGTAPGVYPDA